MIKQYRLQATIGSAGTASVTTDTVVRGKILCVEVNYDSNACTVDIDTSNGENVNQKILDLGSSSTDVVIYPRVALHDNTGTALDLSDGEGGDTAVYGHFVVHSYLTLALASGTENDVVTVFVTVEE